MLQLELDLADGERADADARREAQRRAVGFGVDTFDDEGRHRIEVGSDLEPLGVLEILAREDAHAGPAGGEHDLAVAQYRPLLRVADALGNTQMQLEARLEGRALGGDGAAAVSRDPGDIRARVR